MQLNLKKGNFKKMNNVSFLLKLIRFFLFCSYLMAVFESFFVNRSLKNLYDYYTFYYKKRIFRE